MIKNIIFDLGNVFIPLKIGRARLNFMKMGLFLIPEKLKKAFFLYERGLMDCEKFILALKKYAFLGSREQIIKAWNSSLGDFETKHFELLQWAFSNGYNLFLLSNLNELHLNFIKKQMGEENYQKFESFFTKAYFSHHMGLAKPQREIFEYVLAQNNLKASETLFIDDLKKNILAAKSLNLHTWHFDLKKKSLSELKEKINRF